MKRGSALSHGRNMSNRGGRGITPVIIAASLAAVVVSTAQAQKPSVSNKKSTEQVNCLRKILQHNSLEHNLHIIEISQVAEVHLSGRDTIDYIYVLEDGIEWCGTAGCKLFIVERWGDGTCHLLYEGSGATSFTVLRRRDHGYRRVYAPCEARFDGRQYQQLHEDCPSPKMPR